MAEPFIGEIRCFGFNFRQRGWALLQRPAPADFTIHAAVRDPRHDLWRQRHDHLRAAQSARPGADALGQRLPASLHGIGQAMGQSSVTLTTNQIPQHIHAVYRLRSPTRRGRRESPPSRASTSFLSQLQQADFVYKTPPVTPDTAFSPKAHLVRPATRSRTTTCSLIWCSISASRSKASSPRATKRSRARAMTQPTPPAFSLPAALASQGYALRPESEDDIPFLLRLYASTRARGAARHPLERRAEAGLPRQPVPGAAPSLPQLYSGLQPSR